MLIAVVNQSKRLLGQDDLFHRMAVACNVQLHAAGSFWNRKAGSVIFYPTIERALASARKIVTVQDAPDVANAEGYHTENSDGRVWGVVFTDPIYDSGGTALDSGVSVSSVLSHEILEMWGDPNVNLWAEDSDGNEWAVELCDAVQGDWYKQDGVTVSNFLLPRFFDASAPPPDGLAVNRFDYLGRLTAPFTLSEGGYSVVRTTGGSKEIFGKVPEWKLKGINPKRLGKRSFFNATREVSK